MVRRPNAKTNSAPVAKAATPNKKIYRPNLKTEPELTETLGVDTMLYKAQKFASEMTQEVGYLLKSTGPWLKEIEDQIRGVDQGPVPNKRSKHSATVAANTPAVAPAPTLGKAQASLSGIRNKGAPKRQLGQMSQSPNKIMDSVMAFGKDTWDKVHLVVADLMGQSEE